MWTVLVKIARHPVVREVTIVLLVAVAAELKQRKR